MNTLPDKNKDLLHQLLDANFAERPSPGFNASILDRIGVAKPVAKVIYEPAISLKGWVFIGILTLLILYFALSGSGNNISALPVPVSNEIGKSVETGLSALSSLFETSSMLVICMAIVSVFVLTAAESLYRQSKLKTA